MQARERQLPMDEAVQRPNRQIGEKMNGRTAKLLRKTAAAEAHWQKSGSPDLARFFTFAYKKMKKTWGDTPFRARASLRRQTKLHLTRVVKLLTEAMEPKK
jgi:hypothetical protein